jgi:hypothetical protein
MKPVQVKAYSVEETIHWRSVRLKESMSYHPPPPKFNKLKEEYEDAEFTILDYKDAITVCTCKQKQHAPDCLIHPHITFDVIDPNDNESILGIHSTFLEPITIEPIVEKVVDIKKELPKQRVIKNDEMATVVGSGTDKSDRAIIKDEASQPDLEKEVYPKSAVKYTLVVFLSDGSHQIVDAENYNVDNFVFDNITLEWIYYGTCGKVGQEVFFGKTHAEGFVTVIEANFLHVKTMLDIIPFVLRNGFREEIIKKIKEE